MLNNLMLNDFSQWLLKSDKHLSPGLYSITNSCVQLYILFLLECVLNVRPDYYINSVYFTPRREDNNINSNKEIHS